MKWLNKLLDRITMYRLVTYGLIIILLVSVVFGFAGIIAPTGLGILASTFVLVVACFTTNKILSLLYQAPTNSESFLITALILACLLPPSHEPLNLIYIGLAGSLAMVSKFLLTIRHKHIFNPAAFGASALSLLGLASVTWWIGSPSLLPFVAIFGFLVVRKMGYFHLLFTFLLTATLMYVLLSILGVAPLGVLLKNAYLSGPIIFFGTVMLTEPATLPPNRYYQILYAIFVGVLYPAELHLSIFSTTPHLVLLVGNILVFLISPVFRQRLVFKEKIRFSDHVYDFIFTPERKFTFLPGQYVDITLAHTSADNRGNRRTLSLASSPTEPDVHFGVKFYNPSSSFKIALFNLEPGDAISASQLAGNFVLPKDKSKKLVLIAGGIGITPFRSMLKYIVDTNSQRNVTLFYIHSKADGTAYKDVLSAAHKDGIKIYTLVGQPLNVTMLYQALGELENYTYYISGPSGFVGTYGRLLRNQEIPKKQIITDAFSGY